MIDFQRLSEHCGGAALARRLLGGPRSSMDRAPGFGPGGCGFESCRGRQSSTKRRAQTAERPKATGLPI